MLRPSLLCFLLTLTACADDPAPGALGPCDTPAGPLVSCPTPALPDAPPSIEDACARLVECGVFEVENEDHQGDYVFCLNSFHSDDFTADRLQHVLRCIEVSTCALLAENHCRVFGGEP